MTKKVEKTSSDIIPQTISGAVAGFVSRIVSAPLDVLKIRFQLQDSKSPKYSSLFDAVGRIVKEEGVTGLWKGNIPAVCLWVSYGALQFMSYGELKRYGESVLSRFGVSDSAAAHSAIHFTSGAVSGIVATTFTYPFDIMRTQFAIQGEKVIHTSMFQYACHTYTKNNIAGFYQGLPAAIIGIIPFMSLNFMIYEKLKSCGHAFYLKFKSHHETTSLDTSVVIISGVSGGAAGGLSKLLVYPLDTIKKRMQAQVLMNTFEVSMCHKVNTAQDYSSLIKCFKSIYQSEGFLAFYKGIIPTVTKSVVSTAVTFFTYEGCVIMLKSIL